MHKALRCAVAAAAAAAAAAPGDFGRMMRSSLCVLAGLFAGRVASHPLCFIDDKPTDFDQVLTFCPEAQDGACCTDIEEDNVSAAVDAVGPISTECRELYKKVGSFAVMCCRC